MQNELLMTHLVFLGSANREIVKSTLGFIKLAIHTISVDIIEPHLKNVVQGLLNWAHDHKNHFKAKVRHIFERLIRRFGWDAVYSCVSQEEVGLPALHKTCAYCLLKIDVAFLRSNPKHQVWKSFVDNQGTVLTSMKMLPVRLLTFGRT